MNNIIRAAFKSQLLRSLLNPARKIVSVNAGSQRQFARNLWHMCNSKNEDRFPQLKLENASKLCSCGCGIHGIHTKGERELVEFLTEEILAERKAQKNKNIPTDLDGFKVGLSGSDVTLTKKTQQETIKIQFTVNHTVDAEIEGEVNPNADKPDIGELRSKPAFRVELVRDKTTLSILCSFIGDHEQEEGYNDLFGIDEISVFEGEWNEKVYAVAGEVLDTYLYDLLLNYLEEKGITNEFAEKLVDLSTAYEHASYISLLEGLSKFASGK